MCEKEKEGVEVVEEERTGGAPLLRTNVSTETEEEEEGGRGGGRENREYRGNNY